MRHFEKYSKQDLIRACEEKGLDTGGDIENLIARLKSRHSVKKPKATPEPEAKAKASGSDILNK